MRVLLAGIILLSVSSCAKNTASSPTSLADGVSTTDCAAMLQGLSAAGAKLLNVEPLGGGQLEVAWTTAAGPQDAMCATDLQGKWAQALRSGWPDTSTNLIQTGGGTNGGTPVRAGWPDTSPNLVGGWHSGDTE